MSQALQICLPCAGTRRMYGGESRSIRVLRQKPAISASMSFHGDWLRLRSLSSVAMRRVRSRRGLCLLRRHEFPELSALRVRPIVF